MFYFFQLYHDFIKQVISKGGVNISPEVFSPFISSVILVCLIVLGIILVSLALLIPYYNFLHPRLRLFEKHFKLSKELPPIRYSELKAKYDS